MIRMNRNSLEEISYVFTSDKFGVNTFENVSFRILKVNQLLKRKLRATLWSVFQPL